jgi:hypothetical protein
LQFKFFFAPGGQGGRRIELGAWRTALIVLFALRPALCALRIALPQKLFIKGGHGLQPERIFMQTTPQAFICPKGTIPLFHYSNIPTFQL